MNQYKDLLYRQKYATYQLNNRTFSTQNTKISARSLAISYICFQVRIVKKKKGGGGGKPYYQLLRKIWWLPHPRPPTRALYAKLQREKLQFPITPDDHLEGPYLLKTRELPGAPPPGPPAGALRRAPGPHPYEARASRTHGALRARIFPPTPFFANPGSATVHIPPCSSKSLAPRGVDPGGAGEQSPPPPQWFFFFLGGATYFFGGANISFCPPPPQ